MQTFNFPLHHCTHEYPQGDSVKFGGGYTFAAAPVLPLERTFILEFEGLFWYKQGGVWSSTPNPTRNMLKLDEFYRYHTLFRSFIYPHEVFGNVVVKFKAPLKIPKTRPGGSNLTEPFQLTFVEQP